MEDDNRSIYELFYWLLAFIEHYENEVYKGKCPIHYPECKMGYSSRGMREHCPYRKMKIEDIKKLT